MRYAHMWICVIALNSLAATCDPFQSAVQSFPSASKLCPELPLASLTDPTPVPSQTVFTFGLSPFGWNQTSTAEDFICFYTAIRKMKEGGVLSGASWREDELSLIHI